MGRAAGLGGGVVLCGHRLCAHARTGLRCARAASGADGPRAAHALVVAITALALPVQWMGHAPQAAWMLIGAMAVLIAGALLTVVLRLRTLVRALEWT